MLCTASLKTFFGRLTLLFALLYFVGCYSLSQDSHYQGPQSLTTDLAEYYSSGESYSGFTEEILGETEDYTLKHIIVESWAGPIDVKFYQRHEPSDHLVLVFPVLGGKKNIIENYFADYFARHGYDTGIVGRSEDFKKPENFDRLEQLFRSNVVRDRIALDFFERHYGKKNFGTFGISRGAINVAMTAGVDARLKYNVLALGGADLVGLFKNSNQQRIGKYKASIMQTRGISEDEFYDQLKAMIKTDPNQLAPFMDARNTLLILSLFDATVPIKYGQKLRRRIGNPKTVYLFANHYTSILYTQFVRVVPPIEPLCIFPLSYIETEALDFFDNKFKQEQFSLRLLPFKIIKYPVDLLAEFINWISD